MTDLGQEIFREGKDMQVGRPIDGWLRLKPDIQKLEDGNSEYIFSEKGGCKWSFTVNPTGIILSWKYLSDPALCTQRSGIVPM